MIKAVIIDDDLVSVKFLEQIISSKFSNIVELVAIADSVDSGVQLIQEFEPDLIFLDIQMPEKNGFELFAQLNIINFDVIFITGSTDSAVNAFKVNAIDYLLKPINIQDLGRAINKVFQKHSNTNKILTNKKVGISTSRGILFFDIKDIVFCEASSNYTIIYLKNLRNEIVSKTLKEVEAALVGNNFFRIHKSYLVNLDEISMYVKSDHGYVVMNEYTNMIPVSKFVKDSLVSKLNIV